MRRSHHPKGGGVRRIATRAWATRFAALFAVFLQAFVVQTHVHAFSPIATAGYEHATDGASAAAIENATHREPQAACAVCQAQSSRTLAPAAEAIIEIANSGFVEPTVEIRRVSVAAAYSWQSRAPPAHL
jgi:hypothetical protein